MNNILFEVLQKNPYFLTSSSEFTLMNLYIL